MKVVGRYTKKGELRVTPRSLCRTLKMLRVVGHEQKQTILATALGMKKTERLGDIENAKEHVEITAFDVRRYQDYFGFPASMISAVSQIAAAARDNKVIQLQGLGKMMSALAARLETEDQCRDLVARVHGITDRNILKNLVEGDADKLPLVAMDNVLGLLVMTAWGAATSAEIQAWKNDERLKRVRDETAGSPRNDDVN